MGKERGLPLRKKLKLWIFALEAHEKKPSKECILASPEWEFRIKRDIALSLELPAKRTLSDNFIKNLQIKYL